MLLNNITPYTSVNNKVDSKKQSFQYDPHMDSKIRDYLLEKLVLNNWTQEEMASAIGVTKSALSKWLRGQTIPDYESMLKISNGLGVPFQEVKDAIDGIYEPLPKESRDAIEIRKKYSPEAILRAAQELDPNILQESAAKRIPKMNPTQRERLKRGLEEMK